MTVGERPLRIMEFTDPACPWSWGSEPTLRRLSVALGPSVLWQTVFGILFDEGEDPAPDPAAEIAAFDNYIASTTAHTGAPRAPTLHWVCRTSWPASCAARASETQGSAVAARVLRRLRESSFVWGRPADSHATVRAALVDVRDLDYEELERDWGDVATRETVEEDYLETRKPTQEVCDLQPTGPHDGRAKEARGRLRYAMPTLLFFGPLGRAVVPGWRPLSDYLDAVRQVAPDMVIGSDQLESDHVLEVFPTVTSAELLALTGSAVPPAYAVELPLIGGSLWLHPDEAAVHPALR